MTSLNTVETKMIVVLTKCSVFLLFAVSVFLPLVFQPVGFVTFDSRSGAEAAKNALNVSMALF